MAEYVVRQGFVVFVDGEVYRGGSRVELTDEQYKLYRHRLEGTDRADSIEFEVKQPTTDKDRIGYPAPYISSVEPSRILSNTRQTLTISGSFFTPKTTVEISGATVIEVKFISSLTMVLTIETSSIFGLTVLTFDNGQTTRKDEALEVKPRSGALIDFRRNGSDFGESAIEVRDGMSWERTVTGIRFGGRDPFGSWARLVGDDDAWVWNRSEKRTLSLIFTNTSFFMLGIGSRANDSSSNAQFSQAEILGYFNSATSFTGLYGNAGSPGSGAASNVPVQVNSSIKKITFRNNGEAGSTVSLYELPSADTEAWISERASVLDFTIPTFFAADEPEIMPFLIPRNGISTLFLGMILL